MVTTASTRVLGMAIKVTPEPFAKFEPQESVLYQHEHNPATTIILGALPHEFFFETPERDWDMFEAFYTVMGCIDFAVLEAVL